MGALKLFEGVLLCMAASLDAQAPQPIVHTSLGPVAGKILNGAQAFLGVPYAADTGGSRRFLPPGSREPWNSTRQAVDYGPGCVQSGSLQGPGHDVPVDQSEDCLNMNVYAPLNASNSSSLPILFFIHGGAFREGSNIGPRHIYEGSRLAKHEDIVIFEPNYRVEALGFLTINDFGLGGNYGIMDQRFALTWATLNAPAFGGDPMQITIAGQSAGAMSVGIHMVSPASEGLFHRAIMQSNVGAFKYKTAEEQKGLATYFLDKAGCTSGAVLACLQNLTADEIRAATSYAENSVWQNIETVVEQWGHILDIALAWTPTVGTIDMPHQVQQAFKEGLAMRVPLLEGTNQNEGITFIGYALGKFASDVRGFEYGLILDFMFGNSAGGKVRERYPSPGFNAYAGDQIGRILTDFGFKCGSQRLAVDHSRWVNETYNYRFNHPDSAAEVAAYFPAIPDICVNRTCHSVELPFVFGSGHYAVVPTELENSITNSTMRYWGSFIRGNAPVSSGDAEWPKFGKERQGLLLGDIIKQESEADLCEFWDSIGYTISTSRATSSALMKADMQTSGSNKEVGFLV